MDDGSARTIVFMHGEWVTPAGWDDFVGLFEARGYRCLAPAWPGKDRPIDQIRASRARTEFHEIAGRSHWIIAQPRWEEVAEHIYGWIATTGERRR